MRAGRTVGFGTVRPSAGSGRHRADWARWASVTALVAVTVVAAGCSSGSSPATTTGAPTTTSTAMSPGAVRALQAALLAVGCYSGSIDGKVGSATRQAIRSFQSAVGIAVDGIAGSNTTGKLLAAQRAGKKICSAVSTSTTATTASSSSTTTTAASGVSAPCTTAAVQPALPAGETALSVRCADGWAGGAKKNSDFESAYLLRSSNGVWVQPPANACADAAALGIPQTVLAVSSCDVS